MVHFSIDPTDKVNRTSLGSALRKKRKNLPPLSSSKSAKECNLSRAHRSVFCDSIDPTDALDRTSLGSALRKKRKNLPPLSSGKSAKECNLSRAHRSVLSVFVVVGSHQLMVHYTYNVILYSLGVNFGGLQHLTGGNLSTRSLYSQAPPSPYSHV